MSSVRRVLLPPLWLQPLAWAIGVLALAALLALTAPATDDPAGRIGLALVVGGVVLAAIAIPDRHPVVVALGLAAVGAGAMLVVDADRYTDAVVEGIGAVVAISGVVIGWRARRRDELGWPGGLAIVATGLGVRALLLAYDQLLLPLVLGLAGLAAALVLAVGVVIVARRRPDERVRASAAARASMETMAARLTLGWGSEAASTIEDRLLFEGPDRGRRLIRFGALMAFSSAIASLGVLTDSTAVVIGAMLIAPLLTPLMAMSLSLVSGWTRRLAAATATVAGGAVIAIGIGVVAAAVVGRGVDTAVNTQIVSRASPTMLDLAIALAAGAAGAYATSRSDVSDSLPGVAIAIALVPPLTVVGISAQLGDWSATTGALSLFGTNALAILAMGAITFVFSGVVRAETTARQPVGRWVVAFLAVGVLVLWALAANSDETYRTGVRTDVATSVVEGWIGDRDYDLEAVEVDGSTVRVELVGAAFPDDAEALASQLQQLPGGGAADLDLRVTIQERAVVEAAAS